MPSAATSPVKGEDLVLGAPKNPPASRRPGHQSFIDDDEQDLHEPPEDDGDEDTVSGSSTEEEHYSDAEDLPVEEHELEAAVPDERAQDLGSASPEVEPLPEVETLSDEAEMEADEQWDIDDEDWEVSHGGKSIYQWM